MHVIANILEYAIDNQIPGDLIIDSYAQVAITSVVHTGIGSGQDPALRVVQPLQRWLWHGWYMRIECFPGHS
jgi:hypothetical protein